MRELSPYSQRSLPQQQTEILTDPAIEGEEIHLQNYWWVIRKRLWLILMLSFCTVLTAALVVFMMTPVYTAQTTLLIERQAPQLLEFKDILGQSPLVPDEYDYYKTQYEILQSYSLAAQVIREQGLEENGRFIGTGKKGIKARLQAKVKAWVGRFFPPDVQTEVQRANPLGVNLQVIEDYLQRLKIDPIQRTRLVKVAFSMPDPELSARVANAHAEAYIHQGLDLRTLASLEAQRFLEEKLVELKERTEKSETALNQYRRDRGIVSVDDKENIVAERLAELNKRQTEAEAEKIALEVQFRLVQKRSYDSLPAVIDNTLIRTLTEQLTRLRGYYASLAAQFKSGYPRVVQLKAQVEETQRRLEQEVQKVVNGIESAYLAAEAREKKLTAAVEKQKGAALSLKDASVEYAILSREVDTNRQLYDSVLQRIKEIGVATGPRVSNVSILDKALAPLTPSTPKKTLTLLLSALAGLMGGVGLAFFLEYLDNSLKTAEEVEHYLRLPSLGVLPDFANLDRLSSSSRTLSLTESQKVLRPPSYRKDLILSYHPLAPISEMYRMVQTAILLSRAEEPPNTVLFTSGTPGEGKTTTMINVAITFAQMEARVLVIDADLRHSHCHKLLEVQDGLGLTEVLTGQRKLKEVIKPTGLHNVSLICGGSVPPNPVALLGSKRMREILTLLREDYDYIFIDSPPVVPVTDAVLLSTMVDGVVLVANSQGTPKQVIKKACSRLSHARAKILGVVLNRVTMQSMDDQNYYRHSYGSPA